MVNRPYRLSSLNLKTTKYLALRVSLPETLLIETAENIPLSYCPEVRIPKSSGGQRIINEPKPLLKKMQKRINGLLQEVKLPAEFYGAVKGRSNINNAAKHINKKFVAKFDIKDFFPSIKPKKVKALFIKLGCSPKVASILTKLTTYNGRVPQGAPTSSSLANLILAQHEPRFRELARKFGLTVTFLQDDITFSGNINIARIKTLVERMLCEIDLPPQYDKTKIFSDQKRQMVTGLVVNKKVNVSKEYVRNIRAAINNLQKYGYAESAINSVEGKIAYVKKVNPKKGDNLSQYLHKKLPLAH